MPNKTLEAQRLYDYFHQLPNNKEKLKMLIDMDTYYGDRNSKAYTKEEKAEYEQLKQDFLFPLKLDENGKEVVDTAAFLEISQLNNELMEEAVHNRFDRNIQMYQNFYRNPKTVNLPNDQMHALADAYSMYFSEEANRRDMIGSFWGPVNGSKRSEMFNREMAKDEEAFNKHKERYIRSLKENAEPGEEVVIPSDEQMKLNWEPFWELVTDASEAMNAKLSDRERAMLEMNPGKVLKKVKEAGINDKELKDGAVYFAGANLKGAPWKSVAENAQYHISKIAGLGIRDEMDPMDLRAKMQSMSFLNDKMGKDMKSTFSDTEQYTNMKDALQSVKEQLAALQDKDPATWTTDERSHAEKALNTAMKEAANYVGTHMGNRSSKLGKNRFDAAMAVLGIGNSECAMMIADDINKVRSSEKKPQLVNIADISEKFGLHMEKPVHYSRIKEVQEIRNNKAWGLNEVKAVNAETELRANTYAIFGADEKEQLTNANQLEKIEKGAGLDNQGLMEASGMNALAFLYQKHPEFAGKNIGDIRHTEAFQNVKKEYQDFLQDNQVCKVAPKSGKIEWLPGCDDKLKALAEYHHKMAEDIANVKFGDLSEPAERRKAVEGLYQKQQMGISMVQNQKTLASNNAYLDQYPGGAEGFYQDKTKANLVEMMGKACQQVDNKTAALDVRLGSKLFLDVYQEYYNGKNVDQVAADGKAEIITNGWRAIRNETENYLFQASDKDKKECEAYIKGEGQIPQSYLEHMTKETEHIMNARIRAMEERQNERDKAVENYNKWKAAAPEKKGKKEKNRVEKFSFNQLVDALKGVEADSAKRPRAKSVVQKSQPHKKKDSMANSK